MKNVGRSQASQDGRGACRGRPGADSGVRRAAQAKKRPAGRRGQLRPGRHLHSGQRRSRASPPPSPAAAAVAERFQIHARAGQGPAVAGPRRDPRPAPTRGKPRGADAALASAALSPLTPASYNLGVAVGWRRFAVAGDVGKAKDADPGARRTRERGAGRQLLAQALHRPGRGRRRARRRPRADPRCARRTISRSMSAAPIR